MTEARVQQPLSPREATLLVTACDTVEVALAVRVSPAAIAEALDGRERRALLRLTEKLRERPELLAPPQPSPDQRAAADAYAAALEAVPAEGAERAELDRLAAHAREVGFVPSPPERAVLVSEATSLAELAAAVREAGEQARPAGGGAVHWANLSEDETAELERLVEAVVGVGFFGSRRRARAARLSSEEIGRWLERPPKRRTLLPEGAVALPAGLLHDLARGHLLDVDVALLVVVAAVFATRRPAPAAERFARWEDPATLIVERGLDVLLPAEGSTIVGVGTSLATYQRGEIRQRLERGGWLVIEQRGPDRIAVRLGRRFSRP